VDYCIGSSGVEDLTVGLLPVGVADFKLDFWYGDDLLETEGGGIPEVDGEVVGGCGDEILILEVFEVQDVAFVSIDLVLEVSIKSIMYFEV
jgi:hypothetical protein